MPNNLPPNWSWVKLGDVCEIDSGIGFPIKFQGIKDGKYPFYKVGDISKTFLNNQRFLSVANHYINENTLKELKAKPIQKDSIVFAKIGEALKLNRRAIITTECLVDNNVMVVKSIPHKTDHLFLYYFLLTKKLGELSRSTTVPSIRKSDVEEISFPLPPLPEQKKIVEKIEELFSGLDSGVASLKKVKEQIRLYRQSVLASAFSGKLTTKDTQSTKNLSDLSALSGLPDGWKWVKISEICNVVRGGSPRPAGDPKYYDGKIPFLKVRDLTKDSGTYLTTFEFTIKEAGLHKTRLIKPNTLLLSNSGATLGIPKICMINATMNDGIAAFLDLDERSNLFLYYFWLSKTEELRNINMGAAQPNLNTIILKNYLVPYCSFEFQQFVVEEIEKRFSEADNLEKAIDNSLAKSELLRQSILKQAFEGKLI